MGFVPCHGKGFHSESPAHDRQILMATVVQSESLVPFCSGFRNFLSWGYSDEVGAFIKNPVPRKQ